MRVLIVENYPPTLLGHIGRALDEAGAEIDLVRAHSGERLADDPDNHDAIVVLGGAQNAVADGECLWFPDLLKLMVQFGEADKPVLGICLGSQLLARAHGGQNRIGTATEFGWHANTPTETGANDPVLSAAGGAFPIFQWHNDTFTLPQGAVLVATNPNVHNQAFRIGRASYGTQFHFEVDEHVLQGWLKDFPDEIDQAAPGWRANFLSHHAVHGAKADAVGLAMARAWVGLIDKKGGGHG